VSALFPPPTAPEQDELELLIREARARQRKRWVGAAALVALLAGAALGITSIVGGTAPKTSIGGDRRAGGTSASRCGVRSVGVRILQGGRTVYREPGRFVHPNGGPGAEIQCSGPTIWAVFFNGAGMSQEAYVGVRSADAGRTWRRVFSEGMFGPRAPHHLDAELGVWTLHGPRDAYFVGSCPACSVGQLQGTVSLWVTKDGGRTFRRYDVPALTGYAAVALGVNGRSVRISAKRFILGVEPPLKTVTVPVA
jgi:hypothetical protein